MATMRPTPRNELLGLLSDAYQWMQSPERTQQMQGFAGLLGTTGVPQTVERMAYGEPLTNIGRANVPLLKPETADALMTVAPFAPKGMKMIRATEGLPVGMSIKDVGNKSINVSLNEASNFLSAKSEFGQVGGTIRQPDRLSDTPYLQINYAEVEKASRGKGKGKELYQALIDEAKARGLRVFSDSTVEKPAVNVYKSLEKGGYKLRDMTTGSLEDGTVYGAGANKPAFEISSAKSFQAPQQAALDLAQERAALPIEQGGLGLPANNTAADRAKAMGFDVEAYHGTASTDIQKFMPEGGTPEGEKTLEWYKNRQAQNAPVGYMSFRSGSFFSPKPDYAGNYAPETTGVMYPVNLRMDNPLSLLPNAQGRYSATNAPDINKTIDAMILQDSIDKSINEIAIIDPAQIRSRFAAYDPFRKDVATATAMGVALPDLLAAELPEEELKRNQSAGLLFP
jgi:GNAT superfamily N-acetyltransferase